MKKHTGSLTIQNPPCDKCGEECDIFNIVWTEGMGEPKILHPHCDDVSESCSITWRGGDGTEELFYDLLGHAAPLRDMLGHSAQASWLNVIRRIFVPHFGLIDAKWGWSQYYEWACSDYCGGDDLRMPGRLGRFVKAAEELEGP